MTVRAMGTRDQIAALVQIRDDLDREAFYYRRQASTGHDRQHAIDLEDHVAALDDVIGNLRMADRAETAADA